MDVDTPACRSSMIHPYNSEFPPKKKKTQTQENAWAQNKGTWQRFFEEPTHVENEQGCQYIKMSSHCTPTQKNRFDNLNSKTVFQDLLQWNGFAINNYSLQVICIPGWLSTQGPHLTKWCSQSFARRGRNTFDLWECTRPEDSVILVGQALTKVVINLFGSCKFQSVRCLALVFDLLPDPHEIPALLGCKLKVDTGEATHESQIP